MQDSIALHFSLLLIQHFPLIQSFFQSLHTYHPLIAYRWRPSFIDEIDMCLFETFCFNFNRLKSTLLSGGKMGRNPGKFLPEKRKKGKPYFEFVPFMKNRFSYQVQKRISLWLILIFSKLPKPTFSSSLYVLILLNKFSHFHLKNFRKLVGFCKLFQGCHQSGYSFLS